MKLLQKILSKIHSLPEGVRKLAFVFCSVAAVVVVFNVWTSSVSYKLGAIGGVNESAVVDEKTSGASELQESAAEEDLTIEGPLAGIANSVKSIGEFVKDYTLPLPEKETTSSFFSAVSAKIKYALEAEWNYLNGLYEYAEDWTAENVLGIKIKK